MSHRSAQITIVTDDNHNNRMTKYILNDKTHQNSVRSLRSGTFKVISFSTLKQYKALLKELKSYQFIIYGVPKNNLKEGTIGLKDSSKDIARTNEDITNPKGGLSLLVLDIEIVKGLDHLKDLKRDYTPKQIVKVLKKIGIIGETLITTSSSYSLHGKAKYHVYVLVEGDVKIETFKKVLVSKLSKLGMLYIDINNTSQSSFCDLAVYQPTRVFYEAEALNLDGGKIYPKKFWIFNKGKLVNSNVFKGFAQPQPILRPETKLHIKSQKSDTLSQQSVIPRSLKIKTTKGLIKAKDLHKHFTNQTAVHAPHRDDKTKSATYYPDTDTIFDHGLQKSFTIARKHKKRTVHQMTSKYIDTSLIPDKKGWQLLLSPTGSGKTHFVRGVKGTKLLIVPTVALCENLHNPIDGVYYLESIEASKGFEDKGYVRNIQADKVTVMTWDKFSSMANDVPSNYKIYIDESHNLLTKFKMSVSAKLEKTLNRFTYVTFLSATLNPIYLPMVKRVIQFKRDIPLRITIVKDGSMSEYLKAKGLHLIFNENSHENTNAVRQDKDISIYSGHLEGIVDSNIPDSIERIYTTSVLAEGVSLRVSSGRAVYIHITRATSASTVIQMASRVRDAEVHVFIHTTQKSYLDSGGVDPDNFNLLSLAYRTEQLISLWHSLGIDNGTINKYRTLYQELATTTATSVNPEGNSYSLFNLLAGIKGKSDALERSYLSNFREALETFTPVTLDVVRGKEKSTIFKRIEPDLFETLDGLKRAGDNLSSTKTKQCARYEALSKLHHNLSDVEIMDVIQSSTSLDRYKRHLQLEHDGVYKMLKQARAYERVTDGGFLSDLQIKNIVKTIHNNAKILKLPRFGVKPIEVIKAFMRVKKVKGGVIVVSKKLWKPP